MEVHLFVERARLRRSSFNVQPRGTGFGGPSRSLKKVSPGARFSGRNGTIFLLLIKENSFDCPRWTESVLPSDCH